MGGAIQIRKRSSTQEAIVILFFRIEIGEPIPGTLVYREDEYSFDTEAPSRGAFGSVVINDLQIEIGQDGKALYVWGLCPFSSWSPTQCSPPPSFPGLLYYVGRTLIAGTSISINQEERWAVSVNTVDRWVCLGDVNLNSGVKACTFAPGAIVVLIDDEIKAIWLQPSSLPNVVTA